MKTTTSESEQTLISIRKTGQASAKSQKKPMKSLSMKPVRSMKRMASLKVKPILNSNDKEAL